MKFKEGDILIDVDGLNGTRWTFVRYEEDFGGEFAREFIPDYPYYADCVVSGKLSDEDEIDECGADSNEMWFADGRHILTEITR